MPWGKAKASPESHHSEEVMGYGNTVMTFGDSAAPSKWMYFRLDQYKPNWTSTKRKQTHDENESILYQISFSIIRSNKDIYGYMDKLQLRDLLQYCVILWENACKSTAMKNKTSQQHLSHKFFHKGLLKPVIYTHLVLMVNIQEQLKQKVFCLKFKT